MSIEKIIEPIQTERIRFVDTTFTGTLEAEITPEAVLVTIESLQGATSIRIPTEYVGRVCAILHEVHQDPEVP